MVQAGSWLDLSSCEIAVSLQAEAQIQVTVKTSHSPLHHELEVRTHDNFKKCGVSGDGKSREKW